MDHKCYMLKKNIKPHSKKYVFFDFETKLESKTNKHLVNYCIAQDFDGKENVFHNVGKFGVGLWGIGPSRYANGTTGKSR